MSFTQCRHGLKEYNVIFINMDNESIFNESIFNESIFNESIFKNNTDYDNLTMSESDKNDIKFMLSIMLFVSLCHPCLLIIKDFINRYRDKYKIFKLTIRNISDNLLLNECSICLERYNKNDKIICLDCNHMFHKNCLLLWLDKNNSCPQCRETII